MGLLSTISGKNQYLAVSYWEFNGTDLCFDYQIEYNPDLRFEGA